MWIRARACVRAYVRAASFNYERTRRRGKGMEEKKRRGYKSTCEPRMNERTWDKAIIM